MFNSISQILLYILYLYVFYLVGLGISKLWLLIRILFFGLLFGYIGQIWENVDCFDVGSFFGFIVPILCITWPSIARTFSLYNLSFNPFGFLGWLRDCFYMTKSRRQELEAANKTRDWEREQEARREAADEKERSKRQADEQAHKEKADRERQRKEDAEHRQNEEARRKQEQVEREQKLKEDPYEVLGVTQGMSKAEIRKVYLDLMQKYAPDKVSHLSTEFQKMAHEKCVKFNWAWEKLKTI